MGRARLRATRATVCGARAWVHGASARTMRCASAGGCAPVLACCGVALGTLRVRAHEALKQWPVAGC